MTIRPPFVVKHEPYYDASACPGCGESDSIIKNYPATLLIFGHNSIQCSELDYDNPTESSYQNSVVTVNADGSVKSVGNLGTK